MAHVVKQEVCLLDEISAKMQAMLNGSTITTFRGCGVIKIGSTLALIWVAYEGT